MHTLLYVWLFQTSTPPKSQMVSKTLETAPFLFFMPSMSAIFNYLYLFSPIYVSTGSFLASTPRSPSHSGTTVGNIQLRYRVCDGADKCICGYGWGAAKRDNIYMYIWPGLKARSVRNSIGLDWIISMKAKDEHSLGLNEGIGWPIWWYCNVLSKPILQWFKDHCHVS